MRTFLAAAVLASLSATSGSAQEKPTYKVIAEKELAGLMTSRPHLVVLDARMPDERGQWGLKCDRCSTVQVPFDFGDDPKAAAAALKSFTTAVSADNTLQAARTAKQEVLVVCLAGGRSAAAAGELQKLGFQPVLLDGGLQGLAESTNIKGTRPKG